MKFGIVILVILAFVGLEPMAQAQTSCIPLNQAALLALFSDNASGSSITPANIRSLVCSLMGSGAGTPTSNWTAGDIPVYGNSGPAGNTTGPYLVDSGTPKPYTAGNGLQLNNNQFSLTPNIAISGNASFGGNLTANGKPGNIGAGCTNILAYGGVGDGITDNSAAWTAAIAASPAGKLCVYFPAGTYSFTTGVSVTLTAANSSITIRGDGQDVTNILPLSGNGITVNVSLPTQSVHLRDLSLLASTVNTWSGFNLLDTGPFGGNAASDIINVTFRGANGYQTAVPQQCWANDFFTTYHSVINFINDNFVGCAGATFGTNQGNGVTLFGSATIPGIIYNIIGCNFEFLHIGVFYGNDIEGVSISQSNFTPVDYGVFLPPSTTGQNQLSINNSQFGFDLIGVYAQSPMVNMTFTGNVFGGPMNYGIYVNDCDFCTIAGNNFQGFASTFNPPISLIGININGGTLPTSGSITGNVFSAWNTAAINLGNTGVGTAMTVAGNNYYGYTLFGTPTVTSASSANIITGGPTVYTVVTATANNGSGLTRATVTTSNGLTTGMKAIVQIAAGSVITNIVVIDSTHIDLPNIVFGASGAAIPNNSFISTLP